MVPAGAVAFIALLGVLWDGYQLWVATPHADPDTAIPKFLIALVIYFGALFGFSYGYELYNVPKALRLTIIIGLIGLASVFILLALGALLKGSSSSSKSSRSSNNTSGSGSAFAGGSSSGGSINIPRFSLNLGRSPGGGTGLGLSSPVATGCVFCTRPLPPGGKLPLLPGADPSRFCPKCGQEFEPAGDAAQAHGAAQS
jgi:uncharacterized membrane protein YgcG